MFGKLLKYEFKSVGKWYLGLYAAIIALSLVAGFWLQNLISRSQATSASFTGGTVEGVILTLLFIVYIVLIAALGLSTLLLIINRFRKSVYGQEGYLTMTLPVSSHAIILSKLAASYLWYTLSGLTGLTSLAIIFFLLTNVDATIWAEFQQSFDQFDWATVVTILISTVIDGLVGILLIFFSLSVGQLFQKNRFAFAILTYMGISILLFVFQMVLNWNSHQPLDFNHLPVLTLIQIILGFIYYFGTHYILRKKLNLL